MNDPNAASTDDDEGIAGPLGSGPMDLLDRLGGPAAIRAVTDHLYDRLLADDEIGPLFATTHMPEMRRRLGDYLIGACTGEITVSAERLRAAHAEHEVNDRHFSIMASHLADLLDDAGVDAESAADLLDLIATRRDDVVNHPDDVDWIDLGPTA